MRLLPKRPLSTRAYLFALVAAVLVPLLLFAAFLLTRHADVERARFEKEALQLAYQIALVVDGELGGHLAQLKGLASSTALQKEDFGQFHAEASRMIAGTDKIVVLRTIEKEQLINTQLPFGSPLAAAVPIRAVERVAFLAGRHVVSEVYFSPVSGEPRIAIALPINRAERLPHVLAITVPTARIRDVLIQAVPAGWIVGVGDKDGTFVTRSHRHEEVSGKPGVPEYLGLAVGRSGTFTAVNFEGIPLLAGYYRSNYSDWLFAANIRRDVVEMPLWRSLSWLAGVGVAASMLSLLLAYIFGKPFTAAAAALAGRAQGLSDGRSLPAVRSLPAEFMVVDQALVSAAVAIREREREREEAHQREALLASIFDVGGLYVGVIEVLSDDIRYVVANRSVAAAFGRKAQGVDGTLGSELGLIPEEIHFRIDLARRCHEAGQPLTVEYAFGVGGVKKAWHLTTISPFSPTPEGRKRVAFTAIDISARKRGEEKQQLLVHELNHRVKNTLATVQALAVQILRSGVDLAQARQSLIDRLLALSRAHDVLTRESWEGAALEEIVHGALEPHAGASQSRTAGPPVRLSASLSLSFSMLLHELATNAVKYGALSRPDGSVTVEWETAENSGEAWLRLLWREERGPSVHQPERQGFGSRLIKGSLSSHGGRVIIQYASTGLLCIAEVPLASTRVAPMSEHEFMEQPVANLGQHSGPSADYS